MAFDDTRLPVDVEVGAKGGPNFKTTTIDLASGREQQNSDWSEFRLEADVGYGISKLEDLQAVRAFFIARRGKGRYFRFRDWQDYTLEDEPIGEGDGATTAFQIIKTYEPGASVPYTRRITRPVGSTVQVFVDGVLKTLTTHYTLNADTGVITFLSAPANATVITVTCEFDVPVRFNTDKCELTIEGFQAGVIPSLPIIERRE
jgi:uncharacterized protein (TIGR02217 family)